jgi:hypothetical protein
VLEPPHTGVVHSFCDQRIIQHRSHVSCTFGGDTAVARGTGPRCRAAARVDDAPPG